MYEKHKILNYQIMETKHYNDERSSRKLFIDMVINDKDEIVCTNVIDRGHRNGPERFELTTMGIIKVYNNITNRHITDLIARPAQIYDRLGDAFRNLSDDVKKPIMEKAREHQALGYNNR